MEEILALFNQYARSELMILVPVLYLITKIINASKINNRYIPLIVTGTSLVLCTIYTLGTVPVTNFSSLMLGLFTAFTQGVLFAGAGSFGGLLISPKYVQKLKQVDWSDIGSKENNK